MLPLHTLMFALWFVMVYSSLTAIVTFTAVPLQQMRPNPHTIALVLILQFPQEAHRFCGIQECHALLNELKLPDVWC